MMNELPYDIQRIVDEYLLPKEEMNEVIRAIERIFDYNNTHYNYQFSWFDFRRCDFCEYDGYTFDVGIDGDYCLQCLPLEYREHYPVYYNPINGNML